MIPQVPVVAGLWPSFIEWPVVTQDHWCLRHYDVHFPVKYKKWPYVISTGWIFMNLLYQYLLRISMVKVETYVKEVRILVILFHLPKGCKNFTPI